MKDLFIDNNIAKDFTNPLEDSYKELIKWIMTRHEDSSLNAYLVVSNKLIAEYHSSARNCAKATSMPVIISQLTKEGRLNKFENETIKDFIRDHYVKKVANRLRCNEKDKQHIPIVLLSNRKIALTLDEDFNYDLINFPGFHNVTAGSVDQINYK